MEYEIVNINELKEHPRNYRVHPDDEIEHLIQSIKENGIYRNIVIAKDNVILAGHGVVKAAKKLNFSQIPVKRLDIDSNSTKALKIVVGDNEISHLCETNDRVLSELLKEINDKEENKLLGTGYDEMMLANLIFVTRPESEIKNINEAAEWVGMPEYENGNDKLRMIVLFETEADKIKFANLIGLKLTDKCKTTWYPVKEKDDVKSVRFEDKAVWIIFQDTLFML